MKKSKKQIREEKRAKAHYGLLKIKRKQKVCWLAKEYANGWAIGFSVNDHTRWIRGLRLADREEVNRIFESNLLFIHLKNNPYQGE